jgi:hypothetical protein
MARSTVVTSVSYCPEQFFWAATECCLNVQACLHPAMSKSDILSPPALKLTFFSGSFSCSHSLVLRPSHAHTWRTGPATSNALRCWKHCRLIGHIAAFPPSVQSNADLCLHIGQTTFFQVLNLTPSELNMEAVLSSETSVSFYKTTKDLKTKKTTNGIVTSVRTSSHVNMFIIYIAVSFVRNATS